MKHKMAFVLLIIYTTLVSTGLLWTMKMSNQQIVNYHTIWDKYEYEDRYFVLIEKEITVDEYIGYDIGDEYEYIIH